MIIYARVKICDKIIGYLLKNQIDNFGINSCFYVPISDMVIYNGLISNAYVRKDGLWVAKNGYLILNIDKSDLEINSRSNMVGRPSAVYTLSRGRLSTVQKSLLDWLGDSRFITIVKKERNIKIDMNDLSCLTAITNVEFALFERSDKYILFRGNSRGIYFSEKELAMVLGGRYKWVGHTHPGSDYFCLSPSDGDVSMLIALGQKQSTIYNSVGQFIIFDKESR